MLGILLQGGRQSEGLGIGGAGDRRFPFRQRPGLVEEDDVAAGERLQGQGVFEKNAEAGGAPQSAGEGGGRGKSQGAGAGHHQYRQRVGQGGGEIFKDPPDGKRYGGAEDDAQGEAAGHHVGQPGHSGLGHPGFLHQTDHFRKRCLFAGTFQKQREGPLEVQGAAFDLVAGYFVHRQAFPR